MLLLRLTNAGCHIADVFIGCIMYYRDDLILLPPCVAGLQNMLDVCTVYGNELDIVFNDKSVCLWLLASVLCVHKRVISLYVSVV